MINIELVFLRLRKKQHSEAPQIFVNFYVLYASETSPKEFLSAVMIPSKWESVSEELAGKKNRLVVAQTFHFANRAKIPLEIIGKSIHVCG